MLPPPRPVPERRPDPGDLHLFDRHAKLALILACIALMAGGLGFRSAVRALNVYLTKKPVPLRSHFDNIARNVGDWETLSQGAKLSAEMVEELGTDLYLDRRYAKSGDRDAWLSVHIAYYTGMIDAVPHVPDRCLVAGGFNAQSRPLNLPLPLRRDRWVMPTSDDAGYPRVTFLDDVTLAPVTVAMPLGDAELRTTEFSHKSQPSARVFAGYFFVANGRIAATPEEVKLLAFRKSERFAYYCKVQFFTVGDRELTAEAFAERSADLLDKLLPELMRCLPDWPEIEAGSTEVTDELSARPTRSPELEPARPGAQLS